MRKRKPKALQTPGVAETWKELPTKKCHGCGASFKPIRPEQKFHDASCRSDFHHHGGAYLKLRDRFTRLVRDEMRRALAPITERLERLESADAARVRRKRPVETGTRTRRA